MRHQLSLREHRSVADQSLSVRDRVRRVRRDLVLEWAGRGLRVDRAHVVRCIRHGPFRVALVGLRVDRVHVLDLRREHVRAFRHGRALVRVRVALAVRVE